MADFPITLSYDYFGAPGCGGSSTLSVDFAGNGDLKVVDDLPSEYAGPDDDDVAYLGIPKTAAGDTTPECDTAFRRTAIIPGSRGWRGVVEYLIANDIVAFFTDGNTGGEYPWPDRMGLLGVESVASDLIAAAWSGHPVAHIAQTLARLPDGILETLRDRCGPLRSATAIQSLMRIWQRAYDLDVPFDQIVDRAHRFNFELPWMLRDVRALDRVVEAEDGAARKRRAWLIYPFAPAIDSLIAAWRKANPATSMNSQIGQGMRAGAVRQHLEAYVIEHGRLPVGNQKIGGGRVSPFNVDFDSLSLSSR